MSNTAAATPIAIAPDGWMSNGPALETSRAAMGLNSLSRQGHTAHADLEYSVGEPYFAPGEAAGNPAAIRGLYRHPRKGSLGEILSQG